jgi:hypothetical protein
MRNPSISTRHLALALILGAVGGGIALALTTRAIPKMISQITSGVMQNMISRMKECGFSPAEM